MVDLPTFTNLTAAQVQVLLDTFEPFEGATQAQSREAFLCELRGWLMRRVKEERRRKKLRQVNAEQVAEEQEVETILPPAPMPTPPTPPEPPPAP